MNSSVIMSKLVEWRLKSNLLVDDISIPKLLVPFCVDKANVLMKTILLVLDIIELVHLC